MIETHIAQLASTLDMLYPRWKEESEGRISKARVMAEIFLGEQEIALSDVELSKRFLVKHQRVRQVRMSAWFELAWHWKVKLNFPMEELERALLEIFLRLNYLILKPLAIYATEWKKLLILENNAFLVPKCGMEC